MEGYAFIPEFEILNIVKLALQYIRTDYENAVDKDDSYLRRVLKGNEFQRYDCIAQAEKVFLAEEDDPRYLDAHLMFNMEKEGAPTIHLILPSESTPANGNGIGTDQGYIDDWFDEDSHKPINTRRFQSSYSIVVTSDNSNEVILVYHTLRALLISLITHMGLRGLETITFGGQDLNINSSLMPKGIFFRALTINVQYESSAPDVFSQPLFKDLTVKSKIIIK